MWLNSFLHRKGTTIYALFAWVFNSDLSVTGDLAVTGDTAVTGDLTITGDVTAAAGTLTLNGITLSANAGTPEAAVTGNRKGDLCIDYTNGALYVFAGTAEANTGWKLVTQAA